MPKGRPKLSPDVVLPEGVMKVPANIRLNAVQRSRIMEARRERVGYYLLKGWSEARIAEEIGVSAALVHYDAVEVRAIWQQSSIDAVAKSALLDIARLDFIIAGVLDRSLEDPKAADICIKAIQQKSIILGYNQGVKFDIELYIRNIVEANGFDGEQGVEIATRIAGTLK